MSRKIFTCGNTMACSSMSMSSVASSAKSLMEARDQESFSLKILQEFIIVFHLFFMAFSWVFHRFSIDFPLVSTVSWTGSAPKRRKRGVSPSVGSGKQQANHSASCTTSPILCRQRQKPRRSTQNAAKPSEIQPKRGKSIKHRPKTYFKIGRHTENRLKIILKRHENSTSEVADL